MRSVGVQHEHVEVPWGMIDEQTVINKVAAIAIINLGPHRIGQAHLLAVQIRKWQQQAALPLVAGIIDDDDMAIIGLPGAGIGDEAVRGPIVGPGRLRLDLRPGTVAKSSPLQYSQQSGIKGSDLRVCRLVRAAAEVGRDPDPGSLELAVIEEAQTGGQERDDRRRLMLRPEKFGRGARLVMVSRKRASLSW